MHSNTGHICPMRIWKRAVVEWYLKTRQHLETRHFRQVSKRLGLFLGKCMWFQFWCPYEESNFGRRRLSQFLTYELVDASTCHPNFRYQKVPILNGWISDPHCTVGAWIPNMFWFLVVQRVVRFNSRLFKTRTKIRLYYTYKHKKD